MTIIATESQRFSAVVKHEYEPSVGTCREAVVINDSAQTITVGTVLGKVTATGKYKVALAAAVDGSQTPAAVYVSDGLGISQDTALAANTDTNAIAIVRGPVVLASEALVLGTGITISAVKTALGANGVTFSAQI